MAVWKLVPGILVLLLAGDALASTGKWQVRSETSEIDDSTNVYLSLDADRPIRLKFSEKLPTLFIACRENATSLFIVWDEFISTDDVPVLVRLDKLQATTRNWHISTSYESTFHPQPIAFARRLIAASKLLVEITPHGESPVSTTFNLRGLAEAIKPLQEACHWRTAAELPPADPAQSDSGEMDPKLRQILDQTFGQD